ncbi:hypothetical protein fugu_018062 [Takifugu bimaculatus]|uniref:BOP1 N-terminal domain-containing protein n=1 Tax=Takifugu bimaculatus TaxID=433685 RepID=A0A4Z2BN33_9TELE|nr:hypothetical protein fugu_018062 [Takifugu bimaculatus]
MEAGTSRSIANIKIKEDMKKDGQKTAKKRHKIEDQEDQEEIFNFSQKPSEDDEEEDDDLSDSNDSVYSGLEDSGSESDDDDDKEEEEQGSDGDDDVDDDDDDDVKAESKLDEQGEEEEERRLNKGGEEKNNNEYEHDSSDEEDIRNTVGNIPMEWYKDFPHIGYNLDGKKIYKPIRNKDELDDFLDKMENPDYWRTVHDKQTGSDIVLSDEQLELVNRTAERTVWRRQL